MKKRFLPSLFILITAFCLLSCSNQLSTKTNVSMNFPINDIKKSLSARGVWDDENSEYLSSVELEVKLYVNDKLFGSPRVISIDEENQSDIKPVIFTNIASNSTVYAEARINLTTKYEEKYYTYTVMFGKSEKSVLDSKSITLDIHMNWYDDESRFTPPVFVTSIKYQFYTQKDGTTDINNVDNYELTDTISIEFDPTDSSKYYEYLKSYDVLMQIMDIQFDMEVGGFEEYDTLSNAEPVIEDKTIFVKSYWKKSGEGITPQTFNSVSTNEEDAYTLYFYDDRYVIKNHAGQKVAYGTFYTVRATDGGNNYKFIFCQERAYKDGVPVMLYSMHETPNNFDTCNYNETNNTVTLNCIDSSRNTTPITFTIPGSIDLSAYSYSSLSGNIVYAGIPKVTITYNSSPQMPNLSSGSITFTATLQNEAENPDLDMTAELYFQGRKVASSDYLVDFDAVNKLLTVSPVALSSGGTYIVKVIAMSTSSGTAYTVSNNFIIEIDGYIRKTLDVSDAYFINDLMEFIPTINGPAEITLTGTKNLPGSEYALEDSLYYQMGSILTQTSQPISIDMTDVSGTAVQIFDGKAFEGTSSISIKLPTNVSVVYYREGVLVDISESSGHSSSEGWWKVEIYRRMSQYDSCIEYMNQIFTSQINNQLLDSNTRNQIVSHVGGNVVEYYWNEVCEVLSTGNLENDPEVTTADCDYVFIKKKSGE